MSQRGQIFGCIRVHTQSYLPSSCTHVPVPSPCTHTISPRTMHTSPCLGSAHETAVTGFNLTREAVPPVWVLNVERITPAIQQKMREAFADPRLHMFLAATHNHHHHVVTTTMSSPSPHRRHHHVVSAITHTVTPKHTSIHEHKHTLSNTHAHTCIDAHTDTYTQARQQSCRLRM